MFPARIAAGRRSLPQLGFNRLIVREDGQARESWVSDDHYLCENPDRIPFGLVDPEAGVNNVEDKHLENVLRLTGLMRETPDPVGWTPGDRRIYTAVPRTKQK
jgi:hypothetical protein